MMNKVLTCGAYIIFNNKILLVHPTGHKMPCWGIPKGICEKNELPENTMYREVYEETNIALAEYNHTCLDLGLIKHTVYNDGSIKMLNGFLIVLQEYDYPDIFCRSTYFEHDMIRPEIDGFLWVSLEKGINLINKPQRTLFLNKLNIIKKYIGA